MLASTLALFAAPGPCERGIGYRLHQAQLNIDSGRLHWAGGRTGFERPARMAADRATLPGVPALAARSCHVRHCLSPQYVLARVEYRKNL